MRKFLLMLGLAAVATTMLMGDKVEPRRVIEGGLFAARSPGGDSRRFVSPAPCVIVRAEVG